MLFGQSFEVHDLVIVGVLILLEGVLSIDNALVLGILAKRLPKHLQRRALTYGLVGAFVFRVIAIATATLLIQIRWVKLLGGAYLVYIAVKHFFFDAHDEEKESVAVGPDGHPVLVETESRQPLSPVHEAHELKERSQPLPLAYESKPAVIGRGEAYHFWSTVFVIEMTDIAFAVDSILAAVGMVKGTDKTWVVILGGFLGVILMRFAAAVFIKLLDRFPRFEFAAYLLVMVIGVKLVLDYFFNKGEHHLLDFHSPHHWAFWVFWGSMLACFCVGFLPQRDGHKKPHAVGVADGGPPSEGA